MAPLCCAINASLLLLSPKIGDFRGLLWGRKGRSRRDAGTLRRYYLLPTKNTQKSHSQSYGFLRDFLGPPMGGFESDVRTHKKSLEPKLKAFAVRTGLEPATSGVTGRYSNQLNYRTKVVRTSFSKASAKVLLFFELTKFFGRKMHKNMHFFDFCFVFEYYTMQIWRFLCFSMWLTLFSLSRSFVGEKSSCSCRMMAPSSC